MRAAWLALALLLAPPARADETALAAAGIRQDQQGHAALKTPSGLAVTWVETLQGERGAEGLTARFRFVAPKIAGGEAAGLNMDAVFADMQWLCDSFALQRLASTGPRPSQIVISLADRDLPFGESDPEVTQFFEAYAPGEGHCEWQMF